MDNDVDVYSDKTNFIKVNVDESGNLTEYEKPGFKGFVNNSGNGFIKKMNISSVKSYPSDIKDKITTEDGEIPPIPFLQKKNNNTLTVASLQFKFISNKLNKKIQSGDFYIRIGQYPVTEKYNGKVVKGVNAVPNGDLMIYAIESESYNLMSGNEPENVLGNVPSPVNIGDLFGNNQSYIDTESEKFKKFVSDIIEYAKSGGKVSKIVITASASKVPATCCDSDGVDWRTKYQNSNDPSGKNDAPNYYLTKGRAEHTKEAIQKKLGGPDNMFEIKALGSNGPEWKKGGAANDEKYRKHRYVNVQIIP